MKIRRAGPSDAQAIADLYVQLRDHHATLAPENLRYQVGEEDWTRIAEKGLVDPDLRYYIALREKDVLGFVNLYFAQKPWGLACEVETLVVDRNARDAGVGRALMARAEEVAREEGALAMRVNVLHSSDDGRRFYERSGYRLTAVRYGKGL